MSACAGSSGPDDKGNSGSGASATDTGGAGGFSANGGSVTTAGGATGGDLGKGGATGQGGSNSAAGATSSGSSSTGGQDTGGAAGGTGDGGSNALGGNASGGKATNAGNGGVSGGGKSNSGGSTNGGGGSTSGGSRSTGGAKATGGAPSTGGAGSSGDSGGATACDSPTSYDQTVLCDKPVGFWAIDAGSGTQEPDLSGKGSAGTYKGPAPTLVALPNGDQAAGFNGSSNYLTIPSKASFSIPTTGSLTWEAWIRPSVLQFPNDSGGYVDWMGKCADYSPTCEWEARLYNTDNDQNRCNRLSAYVFNPSAGLGSGADWQPTCGLFQANTWFHVVGEYTTRTQPSDCANSGMYPGAIDIWVNGVKWNHSRHGQTGCFSQYSVVPKANDSPVNVGTMAGDAWFQGAIGKVAIYDALLSQAQITKHYQVMTGKAPTGSCQDTCTF